jgi:DNA polymerase III delta subunit
VTTVPIAYIWGDDEFAIERSVSDFARRLGDAAGSPLERWDIRFEKNRAAIQFEELAERLGTGVMFGGGTLAVAFNLGLAVTSKATRDRLVATLKDLPPGNALVAVDLVDTGKAKDAPPQKALAEALAGLKATLALRASPKAGSLAGWISAQARERDLTLDPGAAKELAERIGGFVTEGDAQRRYQTRTASMELDKLALYRDSAPITVDDVRALVAEAVPGSIWAFSDAVGERKVGPALGYLERLLDTAPEPVLITVLHRRVRELIELVDRLGSGERLAAAGRAMGITSEFRMKTLSAQARNWTIPELHAALDGLLEIDALIKGAPGTFADASQRRLAFTLWVIDHVGTRERRSA